MAHNRKDTLIAPPEWWRHLRPFNKRHGAKRERRAAQELSKSPFENQNYAAGEREQEPATTESEDT